MPMATPEQLAAFESFPIHISEALQGLTEEQLRHVPETDAWSIHEVIIHLADSEAVGFWRLRKTIAEKEALLAVYDEAAWASQLSYRKQDRELSLQLYTNLRAANAKLLRLLPEEAWERTSIHAERGQVSVYDLFNTYMDHGKAHLQQIQNIKQTFSSQA